MTTYFVNQIIDTTTGEVTRYVIAEDGLTLGLGINETVFKRKPLTDYFGTDFPVEVVTRQAPLDQRLRTKVENWRGERAERVDGDGLAKSFFKR